MAAPADPLETIRVLLEGRWRTPVVPKLIRRTSRPQHIARLKVSS